MPPSRPTYRPRRFAFPQRPERGFTLLGAFLALVALALAVSIALGEVRKFKHRAHREQFITDLTTLAAVFEKYRKEKGDWPAGTHAELRVPRGMETVLADTAWPAGPPFGGTYDWIPPLVPPPPPPPPPPDPNAPARPADVVTKPPVKTPARPGLITVTAFSPAPPLALTDEDMRYIDQKLDDGNLATGRFRAGFNGWPSYAVDPAP